MTLSWYDKVIVNLENILIFTGNNRLQKHPDFTSRTYTNHQHLVRTATMVRII